MTDAAAPNAVIRPVRDSDLESLGRVHAKVWHQTYDHLVDRAALENLSPRRIGELWSQWQKQGDEFVRMAALIDGDIVGFIGAGPARDQVAPRDRELYFIYLLEHVHGNGIGQQLLDAAVGIEPCYLWVAKENSARTFGFLARNGFVADGSEKVHPFLGTEITEVRLVR